MPEFHFSHIFSNVKDCLSVSAKRNLNCLFTGESRYTFILIIKIFSPTKFSKGNLVVTKEVRYVDAKRPLNRTEKTICKRLLK